ncbi:hypothetical protein D1872_205530 [compost metagenome]
MVEVASKINFARPISSSNPEITTCCGEFRLAISMPSSLFCVKVCWILFISIPIMAAILPPAARLINSPLFFTNFKPVAKSKAPPANNALYSPRLCPATISGETPLTCNVFRYISALTVYKAGCVNCVCCN